MSAGPIVIYHQRPSEGMHLFLAGFVGTRLEHRHESNQIDVHVVLNQRWLNPLSFDFRSATIYEPTCHTSKSLPAYGSTDTVDICWQHSVEAHLVGGLHIALVFPG